MDKLFAIRKKIDLAALAKQHQARILDSKFGGNNDLEQFLFQVVNHWLVRNYCRHKFRYQLLAAEAFEHKTASQKELMLKYIYG